jgi:hypothetical protein
MLILRKTILVAFLFAGTCLLLIGCGGLQAGKATPPPEPAITAKEPTTPTTTPENSSTLPFSGDVPTLVPPIPNPVGTAIAAATEEAARPTILASQSATAQAFQNLLATPALARDYGSWSFVARRWAINSDGKWEVIVNVQRNTGSVQALKAYAQSNRELAAQLAQRDGAKPVHVLLIFRTYVSRDEFNSWASALGIHPSNAWLRTAYDRDPLYTPMPRGTRPVDLAFGPTSTLPVTCEASGPEPLTKEHLDQSLAMQEQEAQAEGYKLRELKGIYATYGTVDASQLPAIAADSRVFLADISYEWAVSEIDATYGLGKYEVFSGSGQPEPESAFLQMEQFGLDNFTKQ